MSRQARWAQRIAWMAAGVGLSFALAFGAAWWELGQSDAIADQGEVLTKHLGTAACYMCRENCRRFCEANGITMEDCICDCGLECGQ